MTNLTKQINELERRLAVMKAVQKGQKIERKILFGQKPGKWIPCEVSGEEFWYWEGNNYRIKK
jgi:hypothetical protein